MLRPSYMELMDIANRFAETDEKITSRYSIVIAAAKRARQIVDGAPFYAPEVNPDKAVSIAINELENGIIKIFPEGIDEEALALQRRNMNRAGQGLLSADAVISAKDFADDFGTDIDDDSLFEDDIDEETKKAYVEFRETGYTDNTDETDTFGAFDVADEEFGYEEEGDMELEAENENFEA